jgi:hypothetical protein
MRHTSVFFFGMITGLDTQVEVLISLIKPAFSNLCSSAAIALRFGSSNRQRGCLIGLAFGSTFSACSTSSLGTLGMSEGHQAKISQRSRRNSTSTCWWRGDDGVKASSLIHGNGDRKFCDQVDVGICRK